MKNASASRKIKPADRSQLSLDNPGGFLTVEQIQNELEDTRSQVLREMEQHNTPIWAIQSADVNDVTTLQGLLKHGFSFGRWQTPRKWKPCGKESIMDIDLRGRIVHFLKDRHKQMVREADEARDNADKANAGNTLLLPTAGSRVHGILNGALLFLTRYLVLCRVGPAGIGNRAKYRSLDASTLTDIGYKALPPLLALAVSKWLENSSVDMSVSGLTFRSVVNYVGIVQREDLERLSSKQKEMAEREIMRMQMLADMGLWNDFPKLHKELQTVTDPSGPTVKPKRPKERDPHLPLPDDYVAEMGRKSLWIIKELGPNLLAIGEEMLAIWQRTEDPSIKPSSVADRRDRALRACLKGYVWRDSQGVVISRPPFDIRLSQHGENSRKARNLLQRIPDEEINENEDAAVLETGTNTNEILPWPPRSYSHIIGLWALLQRAHLFVVGFAEAPRVGELLTQNRDCVETAVNGMPYATGRTFKLEDHHEGKVRNWVLPDVAVQAIKQQESLIRLAEVISRCPPQRTPEGAPAPLPTPGTHLWGQIGGAAQYHLPDKPLRDANPALRAYARDLGMTTMPGGQYVRFHRFRKTLARLAALALTDSAKILMDVFGHKNINMTLYYILADKDLQADIRKVVRELRVMRAKDTIEAMVAGGDAHAAMVKAATNANASSDPAPSLANGGFGGGAAPRLNHEIKLHRERVHKQARDWGATTMLELAERFTAMGMAWDYPQPGVICIKNHTQAGACTHKIGKRDGANCQSGCDYHLVHPRERANVDGSIRDCIRYYHEAGEKGDDWMQEVWAKQVLKHLETFDDLRAKWMEDSTVRRLVDEAGANGVEA